MKYFKNLFHLVLIVELIALPVQADVKGTILDITKNVLQEQLGNRASSAQLGSYARVVAEICPFGQGLHFEVPQACKASQELHPDLLKVIEKQHENIKKTKSQDLPRCQSNKKSKVNTLFDSEISLLEEEFDKIIDLNKDFVRDTYTKIYEPMKREYEFLYEGNAGVGELFNGVPSCKSIGTETDFQEWGNQGGLFGMISKSGKSGTGDLLIQRDNFAKGNVSKRLDSFINQVALNAKREGLYSFRKNGDVTPKNYKDFSGLTSFSDTLNQEKSEYHNKFKEYKNELGKYLTNAPEDVALLQSLTEQGDSSDITLAYRNWRTAKESQCIYGTISSSKEGFYKIFDNVYDNDQNVTADERRDFKTKDIGGTSDVSRQIKSVLENNNGRSLRDKIKALKKYINDPSKRRHDTNVRARFSGTNKTSWHPSELLDQLYKKCMAGSTNASRVNGHKITTAFKQVRSYALKINKEKKQFAGNLRQSLRASLIDCSQGDSSKSDMMCSPGKESAFAIKGDFCLKNANTCSKSVSACLGNARKSYKNRRNALKNIAKTYNQQVDSHVRNLDVHMRQIQNRLKGHFNLVKSYGVFPKSASQFNGSKTLDILMNKNSTNDTFKNENFKKEINEDIKELNPEELIKDFQEVKEQEVKRLEDAKAEFETMLDKIIEEAKNRVEEFEEDLEKCSTSKNLTYQKQGERAGLCQQSKNDYSSETEELDDLVKNMRNAGIITESSSEDLEKHRENLKESEKKLEKAKEYKYDEGVEKFCNAHANETEVSCEPCYNKPSETSTSSTTTTTEDKEKSKTKAQACIEEIKKIRDYYDEKVAGSLKNSLKSAEDNCTDINNASRGDLGENPSSDSVQDILEAIKSTVNQI